MLRFIKDEKTRRSMVKDFAKAIRGIELSEEECKIREEYLTGSDDIHFISSEDNKTHVILDFVEYAMFPSKAPVYILGIWTENKRCGEGKKILLDVKEHLGVKRFAAIPDTKDGKEFLKKIGGVVDSEGVYDVAFDGNC